MPTSEADFKIGNQPYLLADVAAARVDKAGFYVFGSTPRFSELGEASEACRQLVALTRPEVWSARDGMPKDWPALHRSALAAVKAAMTVVRETPNVPNPQNRYSALEFLTFARLYLESADRWLRLRVEARG